MNDSPGALTKETILKTIQGFPEAAGKQLSMETVLSDLGVDSLDRVELLFKIENAFDVEIPDAQVTTMKTAGDIVNYVANKRN